MKQARENISYRRKFAPGKNLVKLLDHDQDQIGRDHTHLDQCTILKTSETINQVEDFRLATDLNLEDEFQTRLDQVWLRMLGKKII